MYVLADSYAQKRGNDIPRNGSMVLSLVCFRGRKEGLESYIRIFEEEKRRIAFEV